MPNKYSRILAVGYRDWASELYENVYESFFYGNYERPRKFDVQMFTETELLSRPIQYTYDLIGDALDYDLILWYGWSWKIPDKYLTGGKSIMLHPSPLPRYRGGSPIQNQIIAGETGSSVTLLRVTNEIDAGPIIDQRKISLEGSLNDIFRRIIAVGSDMTIDLICFGSPNEREQDHSQATYCKRRTPGQSQITLEEIQTSTAKQLYDKVRCLQSPYPLPYIICGDGSKLYLTGVKLDG